MGRRHIQAVRELGHEVVGIVDVLPSSLSLARDEQGVPENLWFESAEALLDRAKPEMLIVATTATSHCRLVCLAAEHRVPIVLCEKPMAVSIEECDRMIEACAKGGSRLCVNHPMRHMEVYREAKRIVDGPDFGGVRSINLISGNLGMSMNGSHFFELLRYMTGQPPEEVSAWFSDEKVPNPRGPEFEDVGGQLRATVRSGQRLYMEIGTDQGHGILVVYAGPYGILVVDQVEGTMRWSVRVEGNRGLPMARCGDEFVSKSMAVPPGEPLQPAKRVIAELLSGGDYPTGEEGRLTVQALVAAHRSAELGGNAVRLDSPEVDPHRTFPWA